MALAGGSAAGAAATVGSQVASLGLFEAAADLGESVRAGATSWDPASGRYVLESGSGDAAGESGALHLAWRRLTGDFILRAEAELAAGGPQRSAGWTVRAGVTPDAGHVDAALDGDGHAVLRYRPAAGAGVRELRLPLHEPDVLQLERRGTTWAVSVARFGEPFAPPVELELELGDEVVAGLFVSAHGAEPAARAEFRNVRMVAPAGDDLVPYRDYLGSRLEILDVDTGERQVVLEVDDSLQAPNWTPDGEALVYNRNGLLYRFDLAGRRSSRIDTGFADRNNNDHVLSFDGTMLGISHHAAEHDGQSIVYLLPAAGGAPRQVTPRGPSYLHGFSPDGRYLVYTAERGGDYDIYRIPVAGGEEVRLTAAPGLDDGSEYSPDGRTIYFNSVRSGTMQIWRMRADGSEPRQLTDDGFNNWFPHVSPDGRRVVFLSYGPEVAPGDHPFYKQVTLRLMPAEGGEPRVVAYLYGGQGTLNVPSWAPDSRRLAFVSNSGRLGGR